MTLSPTDKQEVLKMAAQRIVEEMKSQAGGDLSSLIVIPLSAAANFVGLSPRQLPLRMAVTSIGPCSRGVTLKTLTDHIAKNTKQP